MAADFQKVYRYNACLCSSVVLVDVKKNFNPVLVFFFYLHDSGFQRASAWATSRENNVDADLWFPWRNADAAAAKKMK